MGATVASGSIGVIPPQFPLTFAGTYDNSEYPTKQTVYTVPAGRTAYITGIAFTASTAVAGIILDDDGVNVYIGSTYQDQQTSVAGSPIFVLTAGSVLKIISATGGESVYFNIWGYLL